MVLKYGFKHLYLWYWLCNKTGLTHRCYFVYWRFA